MRPGLDGSDAGALVRLAQGTTPGTHVGNPDQWWPEWSSLVLSTGLDCQQSMRTVLGKAVLVGLISLVSSPRILNACAASLAQTPRDYSSPAPRTVGLCSG